MFFPSLDDATCKRERVPPSVFFGDEDESSSERDLRIRIAKDLCSRCPDREPCLRWAIHNDEEGVWGGTTKQERLRSLDAMPSQPLPDHGLEWLVVAQHEGVVLRKTRETLNRRWDVVVDGQSKFSHSLESEGWIAWNRWVEARMRP